MGYPTRFPCTVGANPLSVACVGVGDYGQRGDGSSVSIMGTTPAAMNALRSIAFPSNLVPVSGTGGGDHVCVLFNNGSVGCWGRNQYGQLGIGSTISIGDGPGEMGSALALTSLPAPVTSMAAGDSHTCAIFATGRVGCWGYNAQKHLGTGSVSTIGDGPGEMGASLVLVSTPGGLNASVISCGWQHSCALLGDQNVYCWGGNSNGELGIGITATIGNSPPTAKVLLSDTLGPVAQVACGFQFSCVLLVNGGIVCWGVNTYGQLGTGSTTPLGKISAEMNALGPISLPTGAVPVKISAGRSHACALLQSGSIVCWGMGSNGQLGTGSVSHVGDGPGEMGNALQSVRLPTDRKAVDLMCMGYASCAILNDGRAACWGYNLMGGLAIGSAPNVQSSYQFGDNLKTFLIPCGVGAYATALGNATCLSCPAGSYCASIGLTAASPCAAGSYCPLGSTTENVCATGSYCVTSASQVACPAGTYCPSSGLTAAPQCAAGSYCPNGTSQITCPMGSYCPAGAASPTPCSAGSYCPSVGMSNATPCRVGYFCPAGSVDATLCTAGGYCPTTGLSAPVVCPVGSYCPAKVCS